MAMVDWDTAAAVGRRLAPPGPSIPASEAHDAVESLQALSREAIRHVGATTRMSSDATTHRTVVVDRAAWIDSNVTGLRVTVEPLERRVDEKRPPDNVIALTAQKASALQIGGMLSWISTKVLGQYEAITPPGQPGRLLLVVPNIVATERQLDVPARDFRMWVCLHEETHRVQFGSVPWLNDHFRGEIDTFLAGVELSNAEALKRMAAVLVAVVRVLRGAPGASILDAAQSEAQRDVFERLTALMSLLEGHADYVMDAVGPRVVPSLARIRQRFDARRASPGAADGLMRRLLGLDAKLAQYTEGRAFVAGAVDLVGIEGFNQVWRSPANLPTRDEIGNPRGWVDRVVG